MTPDTAWSDQVDIREVFACRSSTDVWSDKPVVYDEAENRVGGFIPAYLPLPLGRTAPYALSPDDPDRRPSAKLDDIDRPFDGSPPRLAGRPRAAGKAAPPQHQRVPQ